MDKVSVSFTFVLLNLFLKIRQVLDTDDLICGSGHNLCPTNPILRFLVFEIITFIINIKN